MLNPLDLLHQPTHAAGFHDATLVHGQPPRAIAGRSAAPSVSEGTPSKAASASSSTSAGTITSNDFLTLLVAELKNQDPTSSQDPNAYINQLVGVNSLQQLIAINQDLTPSTTSGSSSKSSAPSDLRGSMLASEPGTPVAQGSLASTIASPGSALTSSHPHYAAAVAHALAPASPEQTAPSLRPPSLR